jgi:hypothetical protein
MNTSVVTLTCLVNTINSADVDNSMAPLPEAGETIKTKKDMSTSLKQIFSRKLGWDGIIEKALSRILDPIKAKWSPQQGGSNMDRRNRLSIPGIGQRIASSRGVTILVCTKGAWEAELGGACGADKPIRSLIESIRENDSLQPHISIQSVGMDLEERGIRMLEFLDDERHKEMYDTPPQNACIKEC